MLWHQPTGHSRRCTQEGMYPCSLPSLISCLPSLMSILAQLNLFPFFAVESRNPGLLPQHSDPASRLQDGPAHRRVHPHGAVQSETGSNLPRTGLFLINFLLLSICLSFCLHPVYKPLLCLWFPPTPRLISSFNFIGFIISQAAWSRGLLGVLSFHIREEHPQCFPYRGSGLHEQTPTHQ